VSDTIYHTKLFYDKITAGHKKLLVFLPDIDYVSANMHGDIMTNNCNTAYFPVLL